MGKTTEIKTKETEANVDDFINTIQDEEKRKDSFTLIKLMQKATKAKPKLWGSAIIGFGNMRYKSANTGREVDFLKLGFSPRKASFSLYGLNIGKHVAALEKLGKHKTGVGCLYINKLSDIDIKVLEAIINESAKAKG